MSHIAITRASPMTTIQDHGRPSFLAMGIGASGPMDRASFMRAEEMAGAPCGAGVEIGPQGLDFRYFGPPMTAGLAGGAFRLAIDGRPQAWPARIELVDGLEISINTGRSGNYAYLRFAAELDVPRVLDSRATNATAGLGGLEGRGLRAGDVIELVPLPPASPSASATSAPMAPDSPIRFVWGLHADLFAPPSRTLFCEASFRVSPRMDRMGVRLEDSAGIFAEARILSLVSDAVVAGDIQILGDGTPIILMRDHQPTGGYPRIGTVIDADLDRFAQIRPGKTVRFASVTVEHAHAIARGRP